MAEADRSYAYVATFGSEVAALEEAGRRSSPNLDVDSPVDLEPAHYIVRPTDKGKWNLYRRIGVDG